MNRFGSLFKPLTWFMALVLAALVAGCGGGGGGGAAPALTSVCAGAGCVPLGTAGNFVILAETAITDSVAGTTAVTGDVGVHDSGANIVGLTCAEVTGAVHDTDGAGPAPCSAADVAGLDTAATDAGDAAANGADITLHPPVTTDVDPGPNVGPGVYAFTGAATIGNRVLTGSATDIWIFQIGGALDHPAGTAVTLAGGAKAKNVFWVVGGGTNIGAGATLEGVVLSNGAITLGAGAIANGRLLTGAAVTLATSTVTQSTP